MSDNASPSRRRRKRRKPKSIWEKTSGFLSRQFDALRKSNAVKILIGEKKLFGQNKTKKRSKKIGQLSAVERYEEVAIEKLKTVSTATKPYVQVLDTGLTRAGSNYWVRFFAGASLGVFCWFLVFAIYVVAMRLLF